MLTAERLRKLLSYDPEIGVFTWRVSRGSVRAGAIAGTLNGDGYRHIAVDGRRYKAHRLAWLHVHGAWPVDQLDHRFGLKDDNRVGELREATNAQNKQNMHRARNDSASKLLGACLHRGKPMAQIQVGGRKKFLGYFDTLGNAHEFYLLAKEMLHPFGASQGV